MLDPDDLLYGLKFTKLAGPGRDPKRMKPLLKKLRKAWKTHPDLRLGQLLCILASQASCDAFYLEDTTLDAKLDMFIEAETRDDD